MRIFMCGRKFKKYVLYIRKYAEEPVMIIRLRFPKVHISLRAAH